MDFYQSVDAELQSRTFLFVAGELLACLCAFFLIGMMFLHVPYYIAKYQSQAVRKPPSATARRPTTSAGPRVEEQKPKPQPKSVAVAADKTTVEKVTNDTTTAPEASVKQPQPSMSTAQPSQATARSDDNANTSTSVLNSVLEDYFEEERLLDEVLLETTVGSVEDPTTAVQPPTRRDVAGAPQAQTQKNTKSDTIDKDLAKRMTQDLQPRTPAPTSTPPPLAPQPDGKDLDRLLDDFLAEEEMLDETVLDSAINAARQSGR